MRPSSLLPGVEIEPRASARSSVIWLHGLGADGHDFEPIVPELGLDPGLKVRFVFPHAPAIPVTVNGGMVMPAWYDIRDLALERRADEEGLARSVASIRSLVARENERGISCERILLGGFSQGGAVALHVALSHPERLAGLFALSTSLTAPQELERALDPANAALPVFQAHGTHDPMVPIEGGRATCAALRALHHPVEWHEYAMVHQVCLEEIRELASWIAERLAA